MDRQAMEFTAPFDRADADVILRSSDDMHFRVYKAILKAASPVFSAIFTLPDIPDPADTEPHIIPLSEDGETLEQLLRLCYPLCSPSFQSISDIGTLIEVCEKYQMEEISKELFNTAVRDFLAKEPLRLYAMACDLRAVEVAKKAAVQCLQLPFDDILWSRDPQVQSLSFNSYRSLLHYHSLCGKAAASTITCYEWSCTDFSGLCWLSNNCTCPSRECSVIVYHSQYSTTVQVQPFWKIYMEKLASLLLQKPKFDLRSLWPSKDGSPKSPCSQCRARYVTEMAEFLRLLQAQVDAAVSKVEFVLEQ